MKQNTLKARPHGRGRSSGHWVESNIWFNIGVSKTEAAMVKSIAARLRQMNPRPPVANPIQMLLCKKTSADSLRMLLQTALAHFDVVEPLMIQDMNHARQEGFRMDDFWRDIIAGQHVMIGGGR